MTQSLLYIATSVGLVIAAHSDGHWRVIDHALKDQSLTSVAISAETIIAGASNGLWRSADGGRTWREVGNPSLPQHIRTLAAPQSHPGLFLAGTEPAGILISRDDGLNWSKRDDVDKLRDALGWFLPYSPEAGCVRDFATVVGSGNASDPIYAAAEVGGVLVSPDDGNRWQLVPGSDGDPDLSREFGPLIHPDVHSLSVHPLVPEMITAATGGGLYRSVDGGKTWRLLYHCYVRAAWVDPDDPMHIIAGPADGVARNGRIEETFDGGENWKASAAGMDAPWRRHMVEQFFQKAGDLFAILSNGEIWTRPMQQNHWRQILGDIDRARAITAN